MKKAWKEIERLVKADARHKKKGKRLSSLTDVQILTHAAEEVVELAAAPDDARELADILAIAIHYAVKHGWSQKYLEELVLKKLRERFDG